MRFFRGACRIIFSLTFILSGIFKLFDPVGTGLIVDEYFAFMHLGFLHPLSVAFGIVLSTVEFVTGICVLSGLKIKLFAKVALYLTIFFTIITLYLALFNPIKDCGCFGEAIHLTNWQTFFKNTVLLILIIIIYRGRDKATVLAGDTAQWIIVGYFVLTALALSLHSLIMLPQVEFTAYNIGTDLSDSCDTATDAQFETTFRYSKNGEEKIFTIESLPDSTWTFVDSMTRQIGGSTKLAQIDFELENTEGSFFAISIYDPDKLDQDYLAKAKAFQLKAEARGATSRIYDDADRKTMMTLNRSNGGITYFHNGTIVQKWSSRHIDRIDIDKVLDEDPDVLVLSHRIYQQVYISATILLTLTILLIIRYICIIWRRRS